jgi:hypothetical protein
MMPVEQCSVLRAANFLLLDYAASRGLTPTWDPARKSAAQADSGI